MLSNLFSGKYNIDIKIKILNEINIKTIIFLCILNKNILLICNTQKFWAYKIIYSYELYELNTNNMNLPTTINESRNFYLDKFICKYHNIYDNKYCDNVIKQPRNPEMYCVGHLYIRRLKKRHIIKRNTDNNLFICNDTYCSNKICGSNNIRGYCETHFELRCQYQFKRDNHISIPDDSPIIYDPNIKDSDIFCRNCLKKNQVLMLINN